MNTRTATLADLPQLCDLLTLLFSQEAEFQPDTAAQCRGLTLILENPDIGEILVAEKDGQVVGMVNLLYTVSTALGARVAMLEDMIVAPEARGGGAGSDLIQAAIRLARSRGARRITLLTDIENTTAHRFYQKNGFTRSRMVSYRNVL